MATTRINSFEAKPGKAEALRDFLASVIARIVDAPGCRTVELLVGTENPHQLAIIEMWESVAAHHASASRIPPELLKQAQELFAAAPVGRYYESIQKKAV